jgi:hypothetical protein
MIVHLLAHASRCNARIAQRSLFGEPPIASIIKDNAVTMLANDTAADYHVKVRIKGHTSLRFGIARVNM